MTFLQWCWHGVRFHRLGSLTWRGRVLARWCVTCGGLRPPPVVDIVEG